MRLPADLERKKGELKQRPKARPKVAARTKASYAEVFAKVFARSYPLMPFAKASYYSLFAVVSFALVNRKE